MLDKRNLSHGQTVYHVNLKTEEVEGPYIFENTLFRWGTFRRPASNERVSISRFNPPRFFATWKDACLQLAGHIKARAKELKVRAAAWTQKAEETN